MEITVSITDLARSGAGVARDVDGRVIFVPFTAPGDLVRAELVSEDKRYAEARLLEILSPSPERVTPPCAAFGRCGGCEWQHLPYTRQWEAKTSGVLHALKRVEVPTEGIPWSDLPAERIWEYRNRVQLRGRDGEIGFYARASKSLIPIEKCWIARPELNVRLPAVREAGAARPREYKVELEIFPSGEVTETWNAPHSARGFRQVHDEQNEKLKAWVGEHAGSGDALLDLYGGHGNLSLGLAPRFEEIHCVDVGAPPSRPPDAPSHFHFHRSGVLEWLDKNRDRLARARRLHLVLDPPREGLGRDLGAIVETLRSLPVAETLLIGCEPDPWARAVARFRHHGWKILHLGALDFFPQTHHVEALACLRKA